MVASTYGKLQIDFKEIVLMNESKLTRSLCERTFDDRQVLASDFVQPQYQFRLDIFS